MKGWNNAKTSCNAIRDLFNNMQLFRMQFQNQLLKEQYNGLRKQLSKIVQNQEDQRQRQMMKNR